MQALDEMQLRDNTIVSLRRTMVRKVMASKHLDADRPAGFVVANAMSTKVGFAYCMARWPSHIPAGTTSDVPVIGSDLFPTMLTAAGLSVPKDRVIDG